MLKVLARLDKDGRYEEWLRYARAINGLLALALRWAKLVGSLRDTLRAAERVPDLEQAVAWAEHELGTLHLAVEDAAGAERRLERARDIRERLGDTDGLAASEQSLGVLCRQEALGRRLHRRRGPDRRLLLALAAALLLLLIGGVAGAMIDPVDAANALTVRIDGPGSVTSAPDGIHCPTPATPSLRRTSRSCLPRPPGRAQPSPLGAATAPAHSAAGCARTARARSPRGSRRPSRRAR